MAKENVRIINGKRVDISTRDGAYQWIQARAANPDRYKNDDDSKLGNTMLSDPRKQTISVSAAATRLTAAINFNKIKAAEVKVDDLSGTLDSPADKVHGDSEFGEADEENKKKAGEKKEDEVKETVEIAKDQIQKLGELVVNIDDILSNINQQVEEIANPEIDENLDMAEQAQSGEMIEPEQPKVEAKLKVKAENLPDNPVDAYLVTALWAEGGDESEFDDKTIHDFSPASRAMAERDVKKLLDNPIAKKVVERGDDNAASMASDLWLSRNGHGAGFFDRDYPEAEELQKFAGTFKHLDIEVGDDGKVYFFPEESKTEARKVEAARKIIHVDPEIESTKSGWYVITYSCDDGDGNGEYYEHKKFDDKTEAKEAIKEIQKQIKKTEARRINAAAEIKEGDLVKVNMGIVKRYDNMPPYIKLVNQVIRNGEGTPYVSSVEDDFVYIRAWSGDFLGDVRVPKEAVISVGKEKTEARKVNADAEPMTEEHTSAILDYIADNPQVSDADFHEFIEGLGVDIHEAETLIYRTLSAMMADEEQEKAEGQDESHLEAEASKKKVDRESRWAQVQAEIKKIKAAKKKKGVWDYRKKGDEWEVFSTIDDEIKGTHKTEKEAKDQLAALYVHAPEGSKIDAALDAITVPQVKELLKNDDATYSRVVDNYAIFTRLDNEKQYRVKMTPELQKMIDNLMENELYGKTTAAKVDKEKTATDAYNTLQDYFGGNVGIKGHEVWIQLKHRKESDLPQNIKDTIAEMKKAGMTFDFDHYDKTETGKVEAAAIEDIKNGGVEKLLIENYKHEIELLKEGIAYSEEQKANADAWAVKEYDAIIDGNKKRIEEIEQTLKNIAAMNGKKDGVKIEADTIKDYQPGQKVKVNISGKDVDGTVEKSNPTDNTVEVKPIVPGAPAPVATASTDPSQPKPAGTETIKVQLPKEQNNPIKKAMLNRVKAREQK